jgi:hypothetical protein
MVESLVKPLKKKVVQKYRNTEPTVKKVSKEEFLSKIEEIEPVKIKGYVCLF